MTAQERLRVAARSAGWLAEYEVRGPRWIADVLATNGTTFIALEDQLVDDRRLIERSENYRLSGVHVAWFTPRLSTRSIAGLSEQVPLFDVDDIEVVVSRLLQGVQPLPIMVERALRCEICDCPVSTVATFWCWYCWLRFTSPNSGKVVRPYRHLTEWNRQREEARFAEIASAKRGLMEG